MFFRLVHKKSPYFEYKGIFILENWI